MCHTRVRSQVHCGLAPPSGQCRPGQLLLELTAPDSRTTARWPIATCPPRRGSTTLASSTTRAASASSSTCTGRKSHALVDQALSALCNLNHRGAAGAEPDTGDGAGILVQMPDRSTARSSSFELPPAGAYATGIAFLPARRRSPTTVDRVEKVLADEGFDVLGWRDVPVDADVAGRVGA